MADYGTKEYYQEELAKAELHVQLIEEAIQTRIDAGELKVAEIINVAEVLREAQERVRAAKKALEDK